MAKSASTTDALKREVLDLLSENRVMCLATLRPDGWPQATMVGYVHDDLALYFAVARTSQKLSNIRRDPRVSIAVGHDRSSQIRGLSMSAKVTEVVDADEVARINMVLHARYPEQSVFAPREASAALLKAGPQVISIIDLPKGPGQPQLVILEQQAILRPIDPANQESGVGYGPSPSLG